jgi:hypothetical protein
VAFGRYDGMDNYRRLFALDGVSSIGEPTVVGARPTTAASAASPRGSAAMPAGCTPAVRAARPCPSRCGLRVRRDTADLIEAAAGFVGGAAEVADTHAETLMAEQTYLQHAQPSTFGHYLLAMVYPVMREIDRLTAELDGSTAARRERAG